MRSLQQRIALDTEIQQEIQLMRPVWSSPRDLKEYATKGVEAGVENT